jgi:hypothetical protein
MEDKFSVEKWTLDDGRRAEKRVIENPNSQEKITEFHEEDPRPLKLKSRVVEKTKPMVYERKIETLDGNGNVVEEKVESIEPKTQMHLVEHTQTVNAQNTTESDDCHVTREEMVEAIVTALKAFKEEDKKPTATSDTDFVARLKSLGAANEVASNLTNTSNVGSMVLYGVIFAQVLALGYILFLR